MAEECGAATVSVTCDFAVSVRIVAADGVTVVFELNNPAAGLSVESIQPPDFDAVKVRETADGVDGDYTVGETDAADDLIVNVRVDGSTWGQTTTRWLAARTAYRAQARYFVETEIQGVTIRYRTERPENVRGVETTSESLVLNEQTYAIRWHVQPNPTITVV